MIFLSLVKGAVVDRAFVRNINVLKERIICFHCGRAVGKELADGILLFESVRTVTYRPLQLNFGINPQEQIFYGKREENRSLCGLLKAPKRKAIGDEIDLPIKRFCYRAAIEFDDTITSVPYENLPINFAQIEEEELFNDEVIDLRPPSVESEPERFSPDFSDEFYNEETIPFPFHSAIENNLPDYESDNDMDFHSLSVGNFNFHYFDDSNHAFNIENNMAENQQYNQWLAENHFEHYDWTNNMPSNVYHSLLNGEDYNEFNDFHDVDNSTVSALLLDSREFEAMEVGTADQNLLEYVGSLFAEMANSIIVCEPRI